MKTLQLVIMVSALLLVSCETPKGFNDDTGLDISYVDKNNNDLLNTSNKNYYSKDEIRLYSLVNGKKVLLFNGNYDCPYHYSIYNDDRIQKYRIRVWLEQDSTIIHLNSTDEDTITSTFNKSKDYCTLNKAWYNGKLAYSEGYHTVTITK